jgi:TRAP transporter TAXI family solute receptor
MAAASPHSCISCVETPAAGHCRTGRACLAILVSALLLVAGQPAVAQTQALAPSQVPPPVQSPPPAPKLVPRPPSPQQARRLKHNHDTLIVAASRPGATYLAMANDLSSAVGGSGGLRILPIAAEGGLENLRDLLLLRGVDMAIVAANVLAHAKTTKAFGNGLSQRIAYVAPLYGEQVHIIVGRAIASIEDLRGRKVAVPVEDGTGQFTARDIFERLGVTVESVPMAAADAVEEIRSGTIAAAVLVAGKPVTLVSGLPKDGSLRLLSLPSSAAVGEGYSPAVLLAEDYPALIPPEAIVETVAVRAVLVASSDKGREEAVRRIARHIPALFDAIAQLAASQSHTKWKDVNLGAVLPGWKRVPAAEAWLSKASEQQRHLLKRQFDEYLRERQEPASSELSTVRRKQLFEEFQSWARKSITSETSPQ